MKTFQGTPYDAGVDQELLLEIADYFRPIREECLASGLMNPKVLGVDINTLKYQVPGGMLSNLVSQLKDQHAEDKFYDVLKEIPAVREDLGMPPLVTPSSQIVGTQAVMNVLFGERYKVATKETKALLRGEYGQTVRPFNKEVQKKVLGEDAEIITCRPADLIPNELPKLREEVGEYLQQDEDVLSYALFPQVAMNFFKERAAGFPAKAEKAKKAAEEKAAKEAAKNAPSKTETPKEVIKYVPAPAPFLGAVPGYIPAAGEIPAGLPGEGAAAPFAPGQSAEGSGSVNGASLNYQINCVG